mgnify:CR=1 FL=1
MVVDKSLLPIFYFKNNKNMREETFLKNISYGIDRYHGKMTIFYKDEPLKTIVIHKNMDYNDESQELANQIALETELGKGLIKGEI